MHKPNLGKLNPDPSTVRTEEVLSSCSDESSPSHDGHFNTNHNGRVTIHRRHLLHIANDGKQQTRHAVPPRRNATKTSKQRRFNGFAPETDWLGLVLPCTKWLRHYDIKSTLLADIIAGCTVGIMIVPQGMSYAKLAGLPVEYGLYSSLVPVFSYALFGSSRQLAVGPVALISLLLSTGLADIMSDIPRDDPNYQQQYEVLAIQTSFLVGVAYLIMGFLRLGFVTIFLSHAVISGFTTGAAVIIGMSQMKHFFGYPIENSKVFHELVGNLIEGIDQFNYKTFLLGICSVAVLLLMKTLGKKYQKLRWMRPLGPLTVTAAAIILNATIDLEAEGIPVVGHIPKGLPSFTADLWTPIPYLNKLWVLIVSITIVGFMESIAISKQLASKHKYELDSSLELMGLGIANFLGAMFHAYPITGSFSRSAVNNESGAQSGVSGMTTSLLVAITLLFLTPVFEKLPLCVLAAIVISGVIGLLDYEEAMYLWKVHKFDFLVWTVACVGTMFLGVETGLCIAVVVSLLLVIYESAIPYTAVLGRLPGSTVYRNIKQYPEAERYDGILAVRIDAPIYFANTQSIREKLEKYERRAELLLQERQEEGEESKVKYIILELSPVSHVDTSGLHILHDMLRLYKDRGVQLCFSNPSVKVMEKFHTSGLAAEVGEEHIFVTIHDAMNWCLHELDVAIMSQIATSESEDITLVDIESQDSSLKEQEDMR